MKAAGLQTVGYFFFLLFPLGHPFFLFFFAFFAFLAFFAFFAMSLLDIYSRISRARSQNRLSSFLAANSNMKTTTGTPIRKPSGGHSLPCISA